MTDSRETSPATSGGFQVGDIVVVKLFGKMIQAEIIEIKQTRHGYKREWFRLRPLEPVVGTTGSVLENWFPFYEAREMRKA